MQPSLWSYFTSPPSLLGTRWRSEGRKFKKGLHPQIMDQVARFELMNILAELINKASVVEQTLKVNAKFFNQRKMSAL
jgi:hypothetical protein